MFTCNGPFFSRLAYLLISPHV
uniref:Uncharacterized protein n=1 Tax=Anguilla anguilla TaxID=7936 RepID=A0A0E9USM1_ANGAN